MPADETYDVAQERNKLAAGARPGCYNHAPFRGHYYAPDRELYPDGRFIVIPKRIEVSFMSKPCPSGQERDECAGCRWITENVFP